MSNKKKTKWKTHAFKQYLKRDEKVSWTILKDEIVAVDLRTRYCYAFNPMGSFIWDLADGTRTLEKVLQEIIRAYNIDEGRARRDLKTFTRYLIRQKLAAFSNSRVSKLKVKSDK